MLLYRVIQILGPPYRAKLAIAYKKLRIVFSNTTYLKIIWRVLRFSAHPMTHFLKKGKYVYFGPFFANFCPKMAPKMDQILNAEKINLGFTKQHILTVWNNQKNKSILSMTSVRGFYSGHTTGVRF